MAMTMPLAVVWANPAFLNVSVQLELGLSHVDVTVEPFPLGLLGTNKQPESITGFVLLTHFGPCIQFRWDAPAHYDPTTPLAFSVCGDTVAADIWVGEVLVGRATLLQTLCALLNPGRSLPGSAVDAATALFSGAPGMLSPDVREQAKRRLAASLGGEMLPVVDLFCRQGLLDVLWRIRLQWRRALAHYQHLATHGLEEFLGLALAPEGRMPSKALARRLNLIGDRQLIAAFVRVAVGITNAHQRLLLEQAFISMLRQLFELWHDSNAMQPDLLARSCAHLLLTADRMAFAQARLARNDTCSASAICAEFAFGDRIAPLKRVALDRSGGHRVRAALLVAWITRCASEFAVSRVQTVEAIRHLEWEGNEVLEAVVAGAWKCNDLRSRSWNELVHLDWQAVEMPPPDLPQVSWTCAMPHQLGSVLTDHGLLLAPIVSTGDLVAEAREMHNCLVNSWLYLTELLAGRSRIFSIKSARIRATLELSSSDNGWEVKQICGPRNVPLAADLATPALAEWQAIRDFVDRYRGMPRAEAHPAVALCPAQ